MRFGMGLALALALGLTGCGDDSPDDAGGGRVDAGRVDAGGGVDAGARDAGGMDAGSTDAGSTDAGGTDAGPLDGGPPLMRDVRFVAMGDTGTGSTAQSDVADAIQAYCAVEGCDFVILLGDNIYNSGVTSIDDPQWGPKFEDPYSSLSMPFYPVLGNHDYGGELCLPVVGCSESGGLGNEFDKGPLEVMYTSRSSIWTMPDTYYTFQMGHVGFVMMDTNSVLWDDTTNGDQRTWINGAISDLRASGAEWIITAGHHPYLSNGAHGNAGSYESIEVGGTDIPIPLPILDGANVRSFFDTYICGVADLALAGHDHNRQWINEPAACGGTELVVSGAGAKTKDFDDTTRNATHYQDAVIEGFFYVHITNDTFIGRMIHSDGTVAYERMYTR